MATHRMEWRHLMGIEHTEIYQIKVFLDLAVFWDHSIFWFETRDKILERLLIMEQFSVVFLFPKDAGQMFKNIFLKNGRFLSTDPFFLKIAVFLKSATLITEKFEMETLAMDIGNVRDKNNFVTS